VSRSGPRCWAASTTDVKTPLTASALCGCLLLTGCRAVRAEGRSKAEADLVISSGSPARFLLFAVAQQRGGPWRFPLHEVLAELAARLRGQPLDLDLAAVDGLDSARLPWAAAVANLVGQCPSYAPNRLYSAPAPPGRRMAFELRVGRFWGQGPASPEDQRSQALMPFQRS